MTTEIALPHFASTEPAVNLFSDGVEMIYTTHLPLKKAMYMMVP